MDPSMPRSCQSPVVWVYPDDMPGRESYFERRRRLRESQGQPDLTKLPAAITVTPPITCRELADRLSLRPTVVISVAFKELGLMLKLAGALDAETIIAVGRSVGCEIEVTDDPET